jgi:hypothetical protein
MFLKGSDTMKGHYLKIVAGFVGVTAYLTAMLGLWLVGGHLRSIYIVNFDYVLMYGGMGLQAAALWATCNLIVKTVSACEAEWAMEQTRQMIDTAVNLRKAAAKKEKQDEKAD